MRMDRAVFLSLSLLLLAGGISAQRGGSVPGWISDDLPGAIRSAKSSGKPLMIVFRCPP